MTEVYLEVRAALELIGVEEELPDALIFMAQVGLGAGQWVRRDSLRSVCLCVPCVYW